MVLTALIRLLSKLCLLSDFIVESLAAMLTYPQYAALLTSDSSQTRTKCWFRKQSNILILSIVFGVTGCVWAAEPPVLNVYAWSGYLPEAILHEFTQETDIRVNYSTYDSNETLYAKLKANPKSGYDVVMPSSYFVDRMIREGMLKALDKTRLKHFKHLDAAFLNKAYDPHNGYSVPYLWSATGIVVNRSYHPNQPFNHWETLWHTRFKGQLLLLDDMRETFSIALLALGYSPNTQDSAHIKQAYLKLKQLMPNVRVMSTEAMMSLYIDEDLTVGMGWNGDAYRVRQENAAVQFHYPLEGYILSIDSLVIPIGARHVDNAYHLINFLMRPDIAARISLETGYASPNRSARQYLSASLLLNPMLYPGAETLQRGIIQQDVGAQSSLYEQYWELLKIGG